MVTGVVPCPPRFLPSIFFAHTVQQSECSSIFHQVSLTHAFALFASPFVHNKKSLRIYTSMHSDGLELTKLTYTRLEDNLIRHRDHRPQVDDSSADTRANWTEDVQPRCVCARKMCNPYWRGQTQTAVEMYTRMNGH